MIIDFRGIKKYIFIIAILIVGGIGYSFIKNDSEEIFAGANYVPYECLASGDDYVN